MPASFEAFLETIVETYEDQEGYTGEGTVLRLYADGRLLFLGTAYQPDPEIEFDYLDDPLEVHLEELFEGESE